MNPAYASFPNSFSIDSRTSSLFYKFHYNIANYKLWNVNFQNKIDDFSDINPILTYLV